MQLAVFARGFEASGRSFPDGGEGGGGIAPLQGCHVDLAPVGVSPVVVEDDRLEAIPPEGGRIPEAREEILGAVVAIVVALDEDVGIELE